MYSHPDIIDLLSRRFVPIAVDNVENLNMTAAEKAFFEPRFPACTHGMYAFDSGGRVLGRGGGYEADGLEKMLRDSLEEFGKRPPPDTFTPEPVKGEGTRRAPPEGGLALFVTWRVLGGYEMTQSSSTTGDGKYDGEFRRAVGADRLWATRAEADALTAGLFPESLARRIARYHLSYVFAGKVEGIEMKIEDGRLVGRSKEPRIHLEGHMRVRDGRVTRLELLARGDAERISDCGFSASLLVVPEKRRVPAALLLSLADPASDLGRVPPHRIRDERYFE